MSQTDSIYRVLVSDSANVLRECEVNDPPSQFVEDYHYAIIYRRILEVMAEQCDAIAVLCEEGLFRPAHAILRSVLENMASLLWVALDVKRYGDLLDDGKQPNTREILKRIGWEEEYERTFRGLSGFVHTDLTNADMYKEYDLSDEDTFPEIRADGEYYVVQTEDGAKPLGVTPMSYEQAASLYEPYLVTKLFDIIVVGMAKLYTDYQSQNWWPYNSILSFERIISDDPDLAKRMLWQKFTNRN